MTTLKSRARVSIAAALAAALVVWSHPSAQQGAQTFYVRDAAGEMGGSLTDAVEAPGDPSETYRPRAGAPRLGTRAVPPFYTFFPQAGTQGQDLSLVNYVDLNNAAYDVTIPGLDYQCTEYSYGGHNGHDSIIEGFREQAIGVPVFAAAAGTVVGTHDGEPDQQTVNLFGRPGNLVTIDHGGGYQTQYMHLKKDSVSVRVGQVVAAGTQIGLTGSSGNSSGPHLHFTSMLNGVPFEPSAGACRPGDSYWVSQPPFKRDLYLTAFTYGTEAFLDRMQYPFDEVTRSGSYVIGARAIFFRFRLRSVPAPTTFRFVVSRPDGTVALDNSAVTANTTMLKQAWYWFSRPVTLGTLGTWSMDVFANDQLLATAPFTVVASTAAIVNRPPLPIRAVSIEPVAPTAADVPICRVNHGTSYRRDPDYDLVRYRYRWFVREVLVRDVTIAALSDAIPAGIMQAGDALRCEVTPFDDALAGDTVVATPGTSTQQLQAGATLQSSKGAFRLVYQADGNLVLYDARSGAPVWMTNTAGTIPGRLLMQADGNLVLYDGNGAPVWSPATAGHPGAYFSVEDSGNFIVYDQFGQAVWDRYR